MCPDCGRNLPISVPQALLPAIPKPESSAHTRRSKRRPYRRRALKAQVKCRPYGRHFKKSGEKLALGELGSAAGGFQAVLKSSEWRFPLIFQGFSGYSTKIAPPFNHKNGGTLSTHGRGKCGIYNAQKVFGLIILHLRIDVHSCLAVFMPRKILNCLWINASIQKIGNVGMP